MSTLTTQLGVKDEVTYGTPVVVDRFYEFTSESIRLQQGRVQSNGLRSGQRTPRSDRFEPYRIGAAGSVTMDVLTKGFGWWLKHMLGTTATGTVVDLNYTHTGTEGALVGDFFTLQLNRPFNPSGTAQPFTFHGGKVTDWELACDVDGVLVATIGMDFEDEDTSTGLATASYPSDARVFSFAGASMTIAAAAVELKNFRVRCTNGLNVGRRYMRATSLKKEPVEDGMREYTWSAQADFTSLAQYNRFNDPDRADNLAAIVATFVGPVAHAGTTLPQLTVTIPAARFDTAGANVTGGSALMEDLLGVAMSNGTDSPVTIAYRSPDAVA